jgi:hypothetical protein
MDVQGSGTGLQNQQGNYGYISAQIPISTTEQSVSGGEAPPSQVQFQSLNQPQKKGKLRSNICGLCRGIGHNARTCGLKKFDSAQQKAGMQSGGAIAPSLRTSGRMDHNVAQLVTHINLNTDNQASAINALKALNSISFNSINMGEQMVVQGHKGEGMKDFQYSEVVGPAITSDSEDQDEDQDEDGSNGTSVAIDQNGTLSHQLQHQHQTENRVEPLSQQHMAEQQRQLDTSKSLQAMIQQQLNSTVRNEEHRQTESLMQMNLSNHLQLNQSHSAPVDQQLNQHQLHLNMLLNQQQQQQHINVQSHANISVGGSTQQVNGDEQNNQQIVVAEHEHEELHQMSVNNVPLVEEHKKE